MYCTDLLSKSLYNLLCTDLLSKSSCYLLCTDLLSKSVSNSYWTDLQETTGSVPGTWQWGDGTLLTYDLWIPGQPSHASDVTATLRKSDGVMNDISASYSFNFICEK